MFFSILPIFNLNYSLLCLENCVHIPVSWQGEFLFIRLDILPSHGSLHLKNRFHCVGCIENGSVQFWHLRFSGARGRTTAQKNDAHVIGNWYPNSLGQHITHVRSEKETETRCKKMGKGSVKVHCPSSCQKKMCRRTHAHSLTLHSFLTFHIIVLLSHENDEISTGLDGGNARMVFVYGWIIELPCFFYAN